MPKKALFEVIVETVEDAISAAEGGATQLDLKSHYPCSGVTPSAGAISRILAAVEILVAVMIRPHARSFIWSEADVETACEEIRQARKLGVTHFLTGFLNEQHDLHSEGLKRIKDAAGDCELHSHLAWELTRNPQESIEELAALGFSSIRTCGGSLSRAGYGGDAASSWENIRVVKEQIKERMTILLAGGIDAGNAAESIERTGIAHIHCGRGARTPPSADAPVDREKVRKIRGIQLETIARLG